MSISNERARKLWNFVFGEKEEWGLDCFGTWIHRDDHGVYDKDRKRPGGDGKIHRYGWDVDHVRPVSDFPKESDADFWNNYEPMHRSNNEEKADNYPQFTIGHEKYKVVRCEICEQYNLLGYGIKNVDSGLRVDWKAQKKTCCKE